MLLTKTYIRLTQYTIYLNIFYVNNVRREIVESQNDERIKTKCRSE